MTSLLFFSNRFSFIIWLGLLPFVNSPSMAMDVSSKTSGFACPVPDCPKNFTRRSTLRNHFLNCHEDLCSEFPEVFAQNDSTNINKKWRCSLCNRGYTRKGDLKYHIKRKHPESAHLFPDIMKDKSSKLNKKYCCPLPLGTCASGYLRKSDLTNHIKQKHPWLMTDDDQDISSSKRKRPALERSSLKRMKIENLISPEDDEEIKPWESPYKLSQ